MKNSRDKIITRLTSILGKLNAGEDFTLSELAEEFSVSLKTIERDLKAFSFLPIRHDNSRYSFEPYALGKLSYDDIKNFAAISGVKYIFPSLSDAFIADILNTRIHSAYLIKPSGYQNIESKSDEFALLTTAIINTMPITCIYKNKSRRLNPYKLVNHHGIWYLVADDEGVLKNFSFSKLVDLVVIENETFKPDKGFIQTLNNPDSNWFSQNMFDVILTVSPSVRDYFLERRLFPNQTILQNTADALVIKTRVSYDEEILRIVQYWLPHITIIEPEYLQEKLLQNLHEYIKKT